MSPGLTWTYPCAVDEFEVTLEEDLLEGGVTLMSTVISGDAVTRVTHTWNPWVILPQRGSYSYSITATVPGHLVSGEINFRTDTLCEDLPGSPPDSLHPNGRVFETHDEFTEPFFYLVGMFAQCGFGWDSDESEDCVTPYEMQVSSDSTFATGVMPADQCAVRGAVEWCHTYYWRVREYLPDQVGPWSDVASFRIAPPEGWDKCSELPRQRSRIEAVAIQNAACRIGPGTNYRIASYVPAGESHPVDGRNADGTWFRFQDLKCYVSGALLQHVLDGTPFPGGADVGDLMGMIPEVPDPPLPTDTPLPACKSTMGPDDCVRLGGTWVPAPPSAGPPGPGTCNCP